MGEAKSDFRPGKAGILRIRIKKEYGKDIRIY
jgi:hypothetical protein